MEFFYRDENDTERGPYNERQMVDWFREGYFHEDTAIRFEINGKEYKTTIARMRKKNGYSTPFLFAKCDRVDLEREIHEELGEMSQSTKQLRKKVESLQASLAKTSLESKQLMERMQRHIDARVAAMERAAKEDSPAPSVSKPVPKPVASVAPTTSSKTPKELLPLVDVNPQLKDEPEVEDQKVSIRALRDFLDNINLESAQANLKFPINEKCRGCNQASAMNNLRAWLCHITSQKHIDAFRQKGGRVTKKCFDWYSKRLEPFVYPRRKKEKQEDTVEEGTVDLEKKKLECFGGVIMPPISIPLLHIDPSDTTRLELWKGKQEMSRLRSLVFDGKTDKYTAAKHLHLPPTHCDVCNERFDYAPKVVPHIFTNAHIEKYLYKRRGFSQHDFDFWTEFCKLFPEEGKDDREPQAVRAQLREERGRILDISGCKDSVHYTIFGKDDRRRHVVDFISKQVMEHKRPVIVYMVSETPGRDMLGYIQTHLPDIKVDFVKTLDECEGLEVMVTDLTLRLPSRPHAIAFPFPPLEPRKVAEYAQRMCAEGVEANLIVALGANESSELRKFSGRTTVPAGAPAATVSEPAPQQSPSPPPTVSPTPSLSYTIPSLLNTHVPRPLPPPARPTGYHPVYGEIPAQPTGEWRYNMSTGVLENDDMRRIERERAEQWEREQSARCVREQSARERREREEMEEKEKKSKCVLQ
ncbi:hypothetical protein PFISCL1PPCAC_8244 [Pristionchus fissidentatus]|uniref:GYF domain-containing protein n=1 Tax=Pristionchus fissidentatus TaxID=1538716 RepID=A0AAV5VFM1_9BILA|nr:hypothetical protein PFISCL1PPCAC_8244 [Pristionchus fissidentatus]